MTATPEPVEIAPADPAGPQAAACLGAYYGELAARFDAGFDPGPPADPAQFLPPSGLFLIATRAGVPVGCVALRTDAPGVAEVKRLWVSPDARGIGLATRLMSAVESLARAMGFHTLRLDTNRILTEAVAMYRRAGWTEIAAYNDNPYAHHWFQRDL